MRQIAASLSNTLERPGVVHTHKHKQDQYKHIPPLLSNLSHHQPAYPPASLVIPLTHPPPSCISCENAYKLSPVDTARYRTSSPTPAQAPVGPLRHSNLQQKPQQRVPSTDVLTCHRSHRPSPSHLAPSLQQGPPLKKPIPASSTDVDSAFQHL